MSAAANGISAMDVGVSQKRFASNSPFTIHDSRRDADNPRGVHLPGRFILRRMQETRPPKKVEGVGEEAYWSGNRFGGALYVLKKETIVRVSVGGPGDEEKKLSRSKALAEKVLGRL